MSRSHLVDPDSRPSSVASILFLRKPSSHSNDDIVASLFLSLFKFYLWLMKLAMGTQNAVSSHGSMHIDDKEVPWVGSSKPKTFSSYCPIPFHTMYIETPFIPIQYMIRLFIFIMFRIILLSRLNLLEKTCLIVFCPYEFDAPVKKFELQGLKACNLLKRKICLNSKKVLVFIRNFVFNMDFNS
jgi:hypothetical protein